MSTDLTERVARAVADHQACGLCASQDGPCNECLGEAIVALAAVADAPGLEEVLGAHRLNFDVDQSESCQAEDWTEYHDNTFEDHLADVVRAWLRGAR